MAFKRHITADQFGLNDDLITDLLFESVAKRRNEPEAVSQLLRLLQLRGYLSQLPKPLHFQCQLKLYVKTYLPDCPFEINTTTRYSGTPEACITARRPIEEGVIKYLCGILAPLTEEEEQRLVATSHDFNIVTSSRRGSTSLFLVPGRFANHDCEPNAKLCPTENGIQVVAIRYINVGEEITVTCGSDYFGEDNCECLCGTCASLQ